jgi:tight adherence protein B
MQLGLIALIGAVAVGLAAPGCVGAVRVWAQGIAASRRTTLERELPDAFLFVDARRFERLLIAVVIAAAIAMTALTRSAVLGSVAGALTLLLPAWVTRWLRRRRRRRLLYQLPDTLDILAASLRSGLGLLPAVQHLAQHQPAPIAQELSLVIRKQRLGGSLDEALEDLHTRIGGNEVALFVTAMIVARQLGGNLSDVLVRLSQTLREKQAIEGKIAALTAQGRLQARIVGLLPLVLLAVMLRMEPSAMRLLYTTAQGWAALLVLAVLEISGALWLRRLVRIDV